MKTLVHQLSNYGAYHRDPRNIATHFVGIPMIVVAVAVLLSRPAMAWQDLALTPAHAVVALLTLYYLRLDLRYGLAMGLLLAAARAVGQVVAAMPTATWLVVGVGLFAVGWALQFLGHHWEGRKPAFVDDLVGLAIGPLFIVAEAGFALGVRNDVRLALESSRPGR